jgi:N-acetylglucosaminyl-diphospho-decaprenol L-rhamnosyltransferase
MKLLVVIANYRVAHLTIDCLRSIAADIDSAANIRVAVCENGTGDDSARRIQDEISRNGWSGWCTLTSVGVNLGFTGGNNVIIRPALQSADPPQYVLLLNADTVVRPRAFKALLEFMDENPQVGIASSRLEDPDGTPQRCAFRFPTPFGEFEGGVKFGAVSKVLNRWIVAPSVPVEAREAEWVPAASMIVRREVLNDVGLLDEGFFTFYEDVDFCFNARRAGWSIWYVPSSRVVHLVGQTTGLTVKAPKRQPSYAFQARRRYFLKNHGAIYAALADAGLIAGLLLGRLRVRLGGKKDLSAPHFLGDSIRHSVFCTGFKLRKVPNPALATQQ